MTRRRRRALGVLALALFLLGPSFLAIDRVIGLERRTA